MQDEGKYWDAPESPWSVGMRRHTRKFKLMLIGMVIVEAFIGITMYILLFGMDGRGVSGDSISILLYIIVPISMVYPPIMIYRQFTRHRKLVHLIPKSKGRLCPICHITMSFAQADTLKCSRCLRAETNEVIESYWVQYSLDATALTASFLKYKSQGKSGLGKFRTELHRRMIENPVFLAGYMIGIFVIGGMVFGFMNSRSMLGSIFEFSHMMFLMGGVAFVGIGYAKRKGVTMHCVACEYQQAPTGEPSARCPECGEDLRVAGAIVKGKKIRTPRHIAIGIAMMSVGVLLMFNPFMDGWKYKVFPTNSLIYDAVNIWFDNDVWSELSSRSLTKGQEYTLAEGLLDLRLREGYLADGGEIWLLKQFNAGVLPGELTDRLFLECFEFDLLAPTQTVVGQKVDI
ncbi:MAG: hypothetical protein IID30_13535, partial [Planctomycetes bacterium]|nr:hypothetical protein [Planctomycetota bacterium]